MPRPTRGRTAGTLAVVALVAAVVVVPAVAHAADTAFAATGITTDPAPDGSGVVAANRPRVVATFTAPVAPGSTVLLTLQDEDTQLCGSMTRSAGTVSCVPTEDLAVGETYIAVGHGIDADGQTADTDPLEFTVTYPSVSAVYPGAGWTLLDGSEVLSATYDRTIAESSNFRVRTRPEDGSTGLLVAGTTTFASTEGGPLGDGPTDRITWTPGAVLPPGDYQARIHAVGVQTDGAPNAATYADSVLDFVIDPSAPTDLTAPAYINNTMNTAAPFSGNGPAGTTVTVTVHGQTTDFLGQPAAGTATGTVQVPTCPAISSCPWTATVNVGSLNNGTVTWTARATDGAGKFTTEAAGPDAIIDTTAPPPPTMTVAPMTPGSATLSVQGADTDTSVVGYLVKVDDMDLNTQTTEYAAAQNLPATDVDVTGLSDGMLTVSLIAVDEHGNVSGPSIGTATKREGFAVNFPGSELVAGDAIVTFPETVGRDVGRPALLTVAFTEPVKESWQDNGSSPLGDGPVHRSTLCLHLAGGSDTCVNGAAVVPGSDNRSLAAELPEDLADGVYTIDYTVWPRHFCNNVDYAPLGATPNADCTATTGTVMLPHTETAFPVRVDSSAPSVSFRADGITSPITKENVDAVDVRGWTSADTAVVRLLVTSTGGGKFSLSRTLNPDNDADGQVPWSLRDVNLSKLKDGRLSFVAVAVDDAGNATPEAGWARYETRLRLHASRLTEHVSDERIVAGERVRVGGRLVDEDGDPIGGATVTVAPNDGKTLGPTHSVVTDSDGRWHTRFRLSRNATFYASYAGRATKPVHDPDTTHSARTLVHAKLRWLSPDDGSTRSAPVVLAGKLAPNKAGETVTIYRRTADGNRVLGTATVAEDSTWTFDLRLAGGATATVFARIGRTPGNLGGRTDLLQVTVR